MHANAIKCFKGEHWIPGHSLYSSSWTWHWIAQWPTLSTGSQILINDKTIWEHLRENFVASLVLQIFPGLLNFIIDGLEIKLFFWHDKISCGLMKGKMTFEGLLRLHI